MGIFDNIFGRANEQFIGDWVNDQTDHQSTIEFGNVKMSFKKDNTLTYEIIEDGKSQFIFMTYTIKGNKLITDQPSHPRIEEIEFTFKDPTTLILKLGDSVTRYIKQN